MALRTNNTEVQTWERLREEEELHSSESEGHEPVDYLKLLPTDFDEE